MKKNNGIALVLIELRRVIYPDGFVSFDRIWVGENGIKPPIYLQFKEEKQTA